MPHKFVIIGAGSAGISVAARLRNAGIDDIAIIDPAAIHHYQPLWTLVGAGIVPQRNVDRLLPVAGELDVELRWVLETHLHNDDVSGGRDAAAVVDVDVTEAVVQLGRIGFDHVHVTIALNDWAAAGRPTRSYRTVTVDQVVAKIANGSPQVLDVRAPDEWETGPVAGRARRTRLPRGAHRPQPGRRQSLHTPGGGPFPRGAATRGATA